MNKAKERQTRILEYMRQEIHTKGYPPTVREICSALQIKSTSTVHKDIEALVHQGWIRKDPAKPRALMLVEDHESDGIAAPDTERSAASSGVSASSVQRTDIVDIPVVGHIAAGLPILAEENVEETLPVPERFTSRTAANFMLIVRGESMIEIGIMDGDYILVEQTNEARNGDVVVAMVDGFESEATVKTFYKEDGHIRLQPENADMSPIIVQDVRILGKVKGVFRYFN